MRLQYDGSRFFGWQLQKQERTVQGEIETTVKRLTGRRRTVLASGRTDRGVHATGQVAAVDVPSRWTPAEFERAVNALLPDDIWLKEVRRVGSDFHPRYHAISRAYLYRIGLDEGAWSPFYRPWCWPLSGELDEGLLAQSARGLLGTRSFRAFAKSGQPERGHRCDVRGAAWNRWGELGFAFTITANRYLHHMVRYLVGTMVEIARGRRDAEDLPALLEGRHGFLTSPPAPPQGLFLTRVTYPEGVWGGEAASEPSDDIFGDRFERP